MKKPQQLLNELARTYNPRGYADAADQLADYEAVQSYCARHPNAGRNKVGNALELPPGRVRGWMKDVKPDCVHAVHTAQDHGWLDWDSDTEHAIAILLTGINCCGSVVAKNYQPAWAPSTRESHQRLEGALNAIGLRGRERHSDNSRLTELVVHEHGIVLGRLLSVLGAPVGDKSRDNVDPLPEWVLDTPVRTRLRCVELYLLERATMFETKDTITIHTYDRSESFKQQLGDLINSVVADGSVTVGAGITVPATLSRELGFGRSGRFRSAIENRATGSAADIHSRVSD